MALKKNGKERNKLHLTLSLNNESDVYANLSPDATVPPRAQVKSLTTTSSSTGARVLQAGGGCTSSEIKTRSDVDENYTVMSPIRGSLLNTKVLELSPEDTEKYTENNA